MLKFTQDGKFVMQIGKSNQSKGDADSSNVHRAADAWVYPKTNELFVADGYGNHRVIVFDADTGAFKRMWGAFGKKPAGVDNCAIVGPKSFPDAEGPPDYNVVHAIRVANDGMVYVADRENRRLQMFTADGKFVKQLIRTDMPFARDLAFSRTGSSSSCTSAAARASWSSTARRSMSSGRSRSRANWDRATTSRPIRKAISISRRPPPECRSWCSKGCRRPADNGNATDRREMRRPFLPGTSHSRSLCKEVSMDKHPPDAGTFSRR